MDNCGVPPVYYAILKLDGDNLGGWLRGDNSPKVRDVMHLKLVSYYENLGEKAKKGLDAKRPVIPSLHAAISTALASFALHVVPKVVKEHHGTVIYSGGDDTLILLPTSQALECAMKLKEKYSSNFLEDNGRVLTMMGEKATLSGGLVIVHAKDDLRLALQDARNAEKKAKHSGRDVLTITLRRRSGEHSSALCPWPFVSTMIDWINAFRNGASDRWAYHLSSGRPTLEGLRDEIIQAEIRRQVNRAEIETRRKLGEPEKPNENERAGDILANQFDRYRELVVNEQRKFDISKTFNNFIALCQTASFLARGRDR